MDNNPIDKASEAVKAQNDSNIKEVVSLMQAQNELIKAKGEVGIVVDITLDTIAKNMGRIEQDLIDLGYTDETNKKMSENKSFIDTNGDIAIIPKGFKVSENTLE